MTEPETEALDAATAAIDRADDTQLASALIACHRDAVDAALAASENVGAAIALVAAALAAGRRVMTVGAGTSGRLAVLDASELPPTFGVAADTIDARIAGGDPALRRAVEGAEDDEAAGARAVAELGTGDVAIGISASGGAPFVRAALARAAAAGAHTIAIVNARGTRLAEQADLAIVLPTGAEPIQGSTRLRAGTAQKIVLNAISTGAMVRLGKTYGNRMVDLVASNAKLRRRAARLVAELGGVADPDAFLDAAGGRVKTAIVMARRGVAREEAERLLAAAGGRLAPVIDDRG